MNGGNYDENTRRGEAFMNRVINEAHGSLSEGPASVVGRYTCMDGATWAGAGAGEDRRRGAWSLGIASKSGLKGKQQCTFKSNHT